MFWNAWKCGQVPFLPDTITLEPERSKDRLASPAKLHMPAIQTRERQRQKNHHTVEGILVYTSQDYIIVRSGLKSGKRTNPVNRPIGQSASHCFGVSVIMDVWYMLYACCVWCEWGVTELGNSRHCYKDGIVHNTYMTTEVDVCVCVCPHLFVLTHVGQE